MLLNYTELVLVLTPCRYHSPPLVNFQQVVYQLPRQCSREIRQWLVENFQLRLHPPIGDGYEDNERLNALMLKSLVGQAHTLWQSVKHRQDLGVVGANFSKGGQDREITHAQVLSAIREDLAEFPGFYMGDDVMLQSAPTSYSWPAPPKSSCYILHRTTSSI